MSVLAAAAVCVAFAAPPPDSTCKAADSRVRWLNPPAAALPALPVGVSLDPLLTDPAFRWGVRVSGMQRFRIDAPHDAVVEAFVHFANSDVHSYTLNWGGEEKDRRYEARPLRLGPSRVARVVALLASNVMGTELRIESDAPSYELVALRWYTREDFEQRVVPELLARLRRLQADPFFENRRQSRAQRMQELADLAVLSRSPEARREALLQLTRAVYWIAAENHQPRDLERLEELLRACLREMPDHPVVRQMVLASCSGKNVGGNRPMARGLWCESVAPVAWDAPVDANLEGAPEWAAAQWRLRGGWRQSRAGGWTSASAATARSAEAGATTWKSCGSGVRSRLA